MLLRVLLHELLMLLRVLLHELLMWLRKLFLGFPFHGFLFWFLVRELLDRRLLCNELGRLLRHKLVIWLLVMCGIKRLNRNVLLGVCGIRREPRSTSIWGHVDKAPSIEETILTVLLVELIQITFGVLVVIPITLKCDWTGRRIRVGGVLCS